MATAPAVVPPVAAAPSMVSEEEPIVAPLYNEIDPSKIQLEPVKKRTWNFCNAAGERIQGGENSVAVTYNGQPLVFAIPNLTAGRNGVVASKKASEYKLGIELTEDLSNALTKYIDKPLYDAVWKIRKQLFRGGKGNNLRLPVQMESHWRGFVMKGRLRNEEDEKQGQWPDSLFGTIKVDSRGQPECDIVDLEDNPYNYTALAGAPLTEVVIQVDSIKSGNTGNASVVFRYRLIQTSKRRDRMVTTARRNEKRRECELEVTPAPEPASPTKVGKPQHATPPAPKMIRPLPKGV